MRGRPARVMVIVAALVLAGASTASAAGPTLPSQDPFYTYSGSLAGVAPGTVLKTRSVTISDFGATIAGASQVLYRTTGELGQPTVTVATIIKPVLPGTTKIVSYQTAYDALGDQCDPSYTLQGGSGGGATASDEEQLIALYVEAGDTVVVPDYEGTNLDWGAGQESGYGTLDGIRAAEQSLGVPQSSTPVAMVGYSGGSIATEFASELQSSYAPGLDIVGTAEGGVPVDFAHNTAYINGSQGWSGVIPAVLVGLGRAFHLNIDKYSSPYGLEVAHQVESQCIASFYGNYPGLTVQKLLKPQYQNLYAIPQIASISNHLTMSTAGTPKGPLLIGVGNADGTGDGVMVAADVEALAHTYCERGVSVQFNEYSGDDHTEAAVPFELAALSFISERLSGASVANGCSSIGQGNSLAPLPVAAIRYLAISARRHRITISLRVANGTFKDVIVTLQHGNRTAAKVKLAAVSGRWRRVVLRRIRDHRAYTLTVSLAGTTLFSHRYEVH